MTYLYVPLFAIDVFFYTDTATTEIYTYRHTPSLRDALPISPVSLHLSPTSAENLPDTLQPGAEGVDIRPGVVKAERGPHRRRHRSEEHTSELQSLMRISYAVFCLKKKKIDTTYNLPIRHTTDICSLQPITTPIILRSS